jgi:hypothetical protein
MSLYESGKVTKVKESLKKQEMIEEEKNKESISEDKEKTYDLNTPPNFLKDDIKRIDSWLQELGVKKANRDKFIETVKIVRQEYEDTNPSRS